MNLSEVLSNMSPKERVCIKTQSGIVCVDSVKNVKNTMKYFMEYEVKDKKESFVTRKFRITLVKQTTIYI